MPNLQIPVDIEILKFLRSSHNAYEISKEMELHYPTIRDHIDKLITLGYVSISKEETHAKGIKRWYKTTEKGIKQIKVNNEG